LNTLTLFGKVVVKYQSICTLLL